MKNKTILIAVSGAILGGTVALLLAPKMGLQMRRKIIDAALGQLDRLLQRAENKLDAAYEHSIREEMMEV